MWRPLVLILVLVSLPTASGASAPRWESCRAETGFANPILRDCRPVVGLIDPQGRELWLRGEVQRPAGSDPVALYIIATASSEVWFNGRTLGANGRPGGSAATEIPGRYEAAFPIPDSLWRPSDNVIAVRMSSFHGSVHLDGPVAAMVVETYPWPSRAVSLAITFALAGALFAAAFGFGLIHFLRRTGSSLTFAALAASSGLQAVLESLRTLTPYAYPVHGWRLIGIWALTAVFALLLVWWTASRFWPRGRRPLVALALAVIAGSLLAWGFDLKTGLALMAGLGLSAAAVGVGAWRRRPGARLTLGYLLVFIGVALVFPAWLIDLSYFLFAAGFLLPLLMTEMVRLGRDDRRREAVLTRAVTVPDCLTVASSRGLERVPLDRVVAIAGADDYVELRLADGRNLLHAARLDRLEADLPAGFLRVHRSVIANLAHVRGFERAGGRPRLLMKEREDLPISRKRLSAVREALEGGGEPASRSRPAG